MNFTFPRDWTCESASEEVSLAKEGGMVEEEEDVEKGEGSIKEKEAWGPRGRVGHGPLVV